MFHRNYTPVFKRNKQEFYDYITGLLKDSPDGYIIHENEAPYNCYSGVECGNVIHNTMYYNEKLTPQTYRDLRSVYLRLGYTVTEVSDDLKSVKIDHVHFIKKVTLTPKEIMNKIRDHVIEMSAHKPHEQLHLLDVEKKILLLREDASECLRIAGFLHDIDRCTERQLMNVGFANYAEFKNAHAMVSAEIAYEIVLKISKDEKLANRVRELIQKHEVGGDDEQNILMDADSLSFFDVNLAGYKLNHTPEDIQAKINFMKDRMDTKGLEILSILFPNM